MSCACSQPRIFFSSIRLTSIPLQIRSFSVTRKVRRRSANDGPITFGLPQSKPALHSILQNFPSQDGPDFEDSQNVQAERKSQIHEKVTLVTTQALSDLEKNIKDLFSLDTYSGFTPHVLEALSTFKTKILNQIKTIPSALSPDERTRLRLINRYVAFGKPQLLQTLLKKGFYSSLFNTMFTPQHRRNHEILVDFRYPMELFPRARRLKRTIHLHVGPTNSGKTHSALKRLREAKGSTLYAGPLRMLAHEVYSRMNATGRPTWLITGDEKRAPYPEFPPDHNKMNLSCTVEMVPLGRRFEVAIIDEIQMLADPSRGCHWTNALLGICADEIHLCGEERTVDVVKQIVDSIGEELIIHRYERLTELKVMQTPLRSLSALDKGDCIVAFQVRTLQALRSKIELTTGRKCAIVYGSLPSEVRAEQARLFNDPNNDYDFLVATDAIGMGLNLAIKRIILTDTVKRTASGLQDLTISETRQIGGRAGRFRTSYQDTHKADDTPVSIPNLDDGPESGTVTTTPLIPTLSPTKIPPVNDTTGYVTAFQSRDLKFISRCFKTEADPILAVSFQPTSETIMRFFSYFPPGIPYSMALARLVEISQLPRTYFMSDFDTTIEIADLLEKVQNLRLQDRIQICYAPVQLKVQSMVTLMQAMAESIANASSGDLLDLPLDLDILDVKLAAPLDQSVLSRLEELHKCLVLYSWMSFRFPAVFVDRALAQQTRVLVQDAINQALVILKPASGAGQKQFAARTPLISPTTTRKWELHINRPSKTLTLHYPSTSLKVVDGGASPPIMLENPTFSLKKINDTTSSLLKVCTVASMPDLRIGVLPVVEIKNSTISSGKFKITTRPTTALKDKPSSLESLREKNKSSETSFQTSRFPTALNRWTSTSISSGQSSKLNHANPNLSFRKLPETDNGEQPSVQIIKFSKLHGVE